MRDPDKYTWMPSGQSEWRTVRAGVVFAVIVWLAFIAVLVYELNHCDGVLVRGVFWYVCIQS